MKKAIPILAAILFASTILTSCGGGKSEVEIKPKTVDIKGDLSDYFKVVDGSYKLISEGKEYTDYSNNPPKGLYYYSIKVQIKRTDEEFDFDARDLESRGYLSLVCDLLDEQNVPIITADREGVRTQGRNSEDKAMVSLKPGETGWAIFEFIGKEEDLSKVKTFEVCSNVNMEIAKSAESSTSSDAAESSSTSSVDCEQFIKDYSDFADSYIKLLKKYKANPSDASILSEYSEAAQKAMDMQKDASSCTDPAYASELMQIANKIAKASV